MSTLLEDDKQEEAAISPAAAASADPPIVKEIKTMINFAFTNCKPSKGLEMNRGTSSIGSSFGEGQAAAFLLYELGCAVRSGKLLPSIRNWLDEICTEDFEQTFVRDFVVDSTQSQTQKMGKGAAATQLDSVPTNAEDLAILNKTSENAFAPSSGEMRFNLRLGAEIYVPLLSLLSSPSVIRREVLPVQLCPQFAVLASLKDERFGGEGLPELDAGEFVQEAGSFMSSEPTDAILPPYHFPSQYWRRRSFYRDLKSLILHSLIYLLTNNGLQQHHTTL